MADLNGALICSKWWHNGQCFLVMYMSVALEQICHPRPNCGHDTGLMGLSVLEFRGKQ